MSFDFAQKPLSNKAGQKKHDRPYVLAKSDRSSLDAFIQLQAKCPCGGGCPRCLGVQAKLKVNRPGDIYEQEADNVADALMRMPAPVIQRAPT